jgi:hypothetical protein
VGYYGGELVSGRCEDFPCCGHTDGDPCPQPYEVRGTLEYALHKAEQEWYAENARAERRAIYDNAPSTCEEYFTEHTEAEVLNYRLYTGDVQPGFEEAYETYEGPMTYAKLVSFLVENHRADIYCDKCQECIAEAADNEAEWERERYERDNY